MSSTIHPNKKYLTLFYDKCETLIENFTDEEIGKIIKAAIAYDMNGIESEFDDRALKVQFSAIRKDIDLTTEKANKRSESNRANINKRYVRDKSENMTDAEMDAEIEAMFPRQRK